MGGEIMFVEATRMGGEGKITLTGQLGKSIISWLFYRISNDNKIKWSLAILSLRLALGIEGSILHKNTT